MKKSLLTFLIICSLFCMGVVALASTVLWVITVDIGIVEGPTEITVYSDADLTNQISSLSWVEFPRGTQSEFDLWVKNTGVEPINLQASVVGDTSWGDVVITPGDTVSLSSQEVAQYTLSIAVPADTPLGQQSFQIEFFE